jgi:hypothetical protein
MDIVTDLPLAWSVETAKANESTIVAPLIDKLNSLGIRPETCAMDKGYDIERVYGECTERGVAPVIPAARDHRRQARRAQTATLRARRVAVRRSRLQTAGREVALPDGRVPARIRLGQGGPGAPAHPTRDTALAGALQEARRRRAGVRQAQE